MYDYNNDSNLVVGSLGEDVHESIMSYESDCYLNTANSITNSNSVIPSQQKKKKKKKKRLISSLSYATFSDFYILTDDVLGQGSYGKVVTCFNAFTDAEYAVKIISKDGWYYSRHKVLKEIELYYLCQGQEQIIQLVEYFEEDDAFYLIFEKAYGGQLLDQIQERSMPFSESQASAIVRDIATALRFLHDRGIAHRDIKPENILCIARNRPWPVKLCDFDLCSSVYNKITTPRLSSPVGSAEYMAPEVVDAFVCRDGYFNDEEEFTYDKRCDVWSLGILAYILLFGCTPFFGHCDDPNCQWDVGGECATCQNLLFSSIKFGMLRFPESNVSDDAKDLISKCLTKNPDDRMNSSDVLNHPWIISNGKTSSTSSNIRQKSKISLPSLSSTDFKPTNFSKKTFSQNPFQRRKDPMKRQSSMIFPEEFDYRKIEL